MNPQIEIPIPHVRGDPSDGTATSANPAATTPSIHSLRAVAGSADAVERWSMNTKQGNGPSPAGRNR